MPGIANKTDISPDLASVIRPLADNTWFKSIELKSVSGKEALVAVGTVLQTNVNLRRIVLRYKILSI